MAKILTLPSSALRARITLYSPIDVADGLGGTLRSWQAASTRWAQIILPNEASEKTRGQTNGRIRALIRRGAAPFLLPLRLHWRGQMYRVVQLQDVPEQGVQQLICERLG